MNHKNERILKLWNRGIREPERIAKKTGLSLERVTDGLRWLTERQEITPCSSPSTSTPRPPTS